MTSIESAIDVDPFNGRIGDDEIRSARLFVAGMARDAEDCATLLDMLGLLPHQHHKPTRTRQAHTE